MCMHLGNVKFKLPKQFTYLLSWSCFFDGLLALELFWDDTEDLSSLSALPTANFILYYYIKDILYSSNDKRFKQNYQLNWLYRSNDDVLRHRWDSSEHDHKSC